MKKPSISGWTKAWLVWLAALLIIEVPAALRRVKQATLSSHVWRWFPGWPRRVVFLGFWTAAGAHLAFGASAWWLLTAIPFAAVVIDSVFWGGEMSLIDKAIQALAARWFKSRVDKARQGDSMIAKILKALDGWKLQLGVTAMFLVGVWDAYHNGHAGSIVGSILAVLGWLPGEQSGFTVTGVAAAASSAVVVIGYFAKLWKAQQQVRAGATLAETGGSVGIVKAAIADGSLKVTDLSGTASPVSSVLVKVEGKLVALAEGDVDRRLGNNVPASVPRI